MPNIQPTRVPALGYRRDGPGLWRFYDITDGTQRAAGVGPQYKTKAELLADLDRYAQAAGWIERARQDDLADALHIVLDLAGCSLAGDDEPDAQAEHARAIERVERFLESL